MLFAVLGIVVVVHGKHPGPQKGKVRQCWKKNTGYHSYSSLKTDNHSPGSRVVSPGNLKNDSFEAGATALDGLCQDTYTELRFPSVLSSGHLKKSWVCLAPHRFWVANHIRCSSKWFSLLSQLTRPITPLSVVFWDMHNFQLCALKSLCFLYEIILRNCYLILLSEIILI